MKKKNIKKMKKERKIDKIIIIKLNATQSRLVDLLSNYVMFYFFAGNGLTTIINILPPKYLFFLKLNIYFPKTNKTSLNSNQHTKLMHRNSRPIPVQALNH